MEDLTGKQFGPYQIVSPLGEGGMATVYKAYQPAMERYVALKILPSHFAEDPQFSARFQREAKVLAQLQHSYILPVFDSGQAEGYAYIVMPFVQSGTLTDLLKGQPLSLPLIGQIITQIGEALSYAHARGLIHRDIKPSNVLMDESGNCLLADFGLARIVEASVNLTASGAIMGTPAYISPEQGSGQKVDARSDIYSLGVILYELVTGRVPYKAETPVAVIFKHIQDPLPSARELNPELPEALEPVILKALSKNPEDRYQTAADMVKALKVAISDVPLTPPRAATLKRLVKVAKAVDRPWMYWTLGVVALSILGIFFGPRAWTAVSTAITNRTPILTEAPISDENEIIATETAATVPATITREPVSSESTLTTTEPPHFYEPILDYIEIETPTFEDDFSTQKEEWGKKGSGQWVYVETRDGVLQVPFGSGPGTVTLPSKPYLYLLSSENFVISVDWALEKDTDSIEFVFRSSLDETAYYKYVYSRGGTWKLVQNNGSREFGLKYGSFQPVPGSESKWSTNAAGDKWMSTPLNKFEFIVLEENLAIYVNGDLVVEFNELDSHGDWNFFQHNGGTHPMMDNFKFWNLDGMEFNE